MTAWRLHNSTPAVVLWDTNADTKLTQWVADVVNEYCDVPAKVISLP